ncbi:SDR family oxidoreductase [Glycomyces salinus]|uniref:SDR family oxidoreductase n=1 Tax=Glycomyces salinus TaxID=980294 RepID=UPI0018ED7E13|nr:SDR family oxidoreductase [Glycomyces salinus]
MEDKIALITGANKGIGFEIAKGLAERGVTVLAGARSEERGRKAAAEIGVGFLQLDVTEPDSVANAARQVADRYGRLDILVNNAGIAKADGNWNTSELTLATARKVFEVNFFGVISVTNAFLPLVHRAESGRIVNVSSELGSLGTITDPSFPFGDIQPGAYGASKSALNLLTVSYAKELRDTPIKINAVTPGYTATDLNGNQGHRTPAEGARSAIDAALIGDDGPNGAFLSDGEIDFLEGVVVPW